jgi:hypothetical protein
VFRKLDTIAVLTARLLPAPHPDPPARPDPVDAEQLSPAGAEDGDGQAMAPAAQESAPAAPAAAMATTRATTATASAAAITTTPIVSNLQARIRGLRAVCSSSMIRFQSGAR